MLSWDRMMDRHPAGHLVTGFHDGKDRVNRERLLARLIEALKPTGQFAIRKHRDRDLYLMQAFFARKDDAERLGEALQARRGSGDPGWATQRTFSFDKTTCDKLDAVLPS